MSGAAVFTPIVREPGLAPYRSILVDWLGCGFSDRPESFGYSLEDHAATIALLLDQIGLKACAVIGFSMGGAVAIALAAARPDLVARLVLVEALLDPGGGSFSAPIAAQTEEAFVGGGYATVLRELRDAGEAGDASAARLVGVLQTAAPHALYRSARGLVRGTQPTMRERLLQLPIPRAYLFGEQSLPHTDQAWLARQGIRVLVVPRAGHVVMWDNPSGAAEMIEAALKDERET